MTEKFEALPHAEPAPSREFDCIIVGSGAGGGPLASRLALAGKRVLVLEAGSDQSKLPPADGPLEVSLVPGFHAVSTEHSDLSWQFFVKHYDNPPTGRDPKWHEGTRPDGQDKGIFYPRASALGGCTIHNALITIIGPDSDWDDLADFLGDESWQSVRMRQYFQRLERNEYLDASARIPTSWRGRFWENLRWLFGFEPDHRAGRHGFEGWLHTSTADLALGLSDLQLIKVLKAAILQCKRVGIFRLGRFFRQALTGGLVRSLLRGLGHWTLDPNHARRQAQSPEGLILVPIAACGKKTTIHQNSATPFVQRGRRSSPREFLLETQAAHPDRLTIWTDCLATKVLFDRGNPPQAVGVEFLRGKHLYQAHQKPSDKPGEQDKVFVKAGGEVILCGGAFNTPQLLMLSGIGNRDDLEHVSKQAGANSMEQAEGEHKQETCALFGRDGQVLRGQDGDPLRIHLPGVGCNLQDRYEVTVISQMRKDFSLLEGATFRLPDPQPDRHLKEWRAAGAGLYTSNGPVVGIFRRSKPELEQPDLFIFGIPLPFKGYEIGYSKVGHLHNFFTWTILKAHTNNHDGVVKLRSHDPLATPEINFHYFNETTRRGQSHDDLDLEALVEGVKFVRGIADLAGTGREKESHPGGSEVPENNVEQMKNWIRQVAWGHHACGTCRMGPEGDENAVLDSRFCVRGIKGLRVVDASVFPKIPGYFIVNNIYMASEKAAEVILEDASRTPPASPTYPSELRQLELEALLDRRDQAKLDAGRSNGEAWSDEVTGLGLSGGGIRSATLNLGVLQALAKNRWLPRIDFLSTVSGGGYIGAFVGRYFDRLRVQQMPQPQGTPPRTGPERVAKELTDPDSCAIAWLRKSGKYLAPQGQSDAFLNLAVYIRNFLSVHFVIGTLLFALFGLANALRYAVFDPATAGLGLVPIETTELPLGHLLQALLGPFYNPWFVLAELLFLFLVLPRMLGYWIVSQDRHERFQGPPLAIMFILGTVLFFLGVYDGLVLEPLILGIALFSSLIQVEVAWRRSSILEEAAGSGGVEAQRLRTRNTLTFDLGLALALTGAAVGFALIDALGHGLQQWLIEANVNYAKAFAAIAAALAALMPLTSMAVNFFARTINEAGPPSTLRRIFEKQLVAILLALLLSTGPLVFYSFASHAAYGGGSNLLFGIGATVLACVISFVLIHPKALPFVNRSSLAQEYAARLARAYLGASNPLRRRPAGADITEVIPGDDIPSIQDYKPHKAGGPLHLINMTVNQTVDFTSQRGNRDRLGENLAVSYLGLSVGQRWHCAWPDPAANGADCARRHPVRLKPLGYVSGTDHPLIDETGKASNRAEMLSLRQWISISGAAVGPGRGAATQLGTALLFGLANLRTGYWWDSGIPKAAHDGFPRLSFIRRLLYLLPRLFLTQSLLLHEWIARYQGPWARYWYISDGGFFENMGGYELVRRRIPRIIISDGSADATYQFEGLADLTRKVRIDFNATIEPFTQAELQQFVPASLQSRIGTLDQLKPATDKDGNITGPAAKHAALFWVKYQTHPARKSVLLYLKATLTGDESVDIAHYHATHPEFPHESTEDQFFDEPQWESYRNLGQHLSDPLFQDNAWFWSIPL
jgi:choline dehydrogenase-like flavoprotein